MKFKENQQYMKNKSFKYSQLPKDRSLKPFNHKKRSLFEVNTKCDLTDDKSIVAMNITSTFKVEVEDKPKMPEILSRTRSSLLSFGNNVNQTENTVILPLKKRIDYLNLSLPRNFCDFFHYKPRREALFNDLITYSTLDMIWLPKTKPIMYEVHKDYVNFNTNGSRIDLLHSYVDSISKNTDKKKNARNVLYQKSISFEQMPNKDNSNDGEERHNHLDNKNFNIDDSKIETNSSKIVNLDKSKLKHKRKYVNKWIKIIDKLNKTSLQEVSL